jgi:hypothetical protein
MTRVVLDAELRSKLQGLTGPVELCDESGKVVARVLPVPDGRSAGLSGETAMPSEHDDQAAFRRLKPLIDQSYERGRFVAIFEGEIVADAASFEELEQLLRQKGKDSRQVLVIQAGVDYSEYAIILTQEARA